jgi:SAM-dependent methyltransferase
MVTQQFPISISLTDLKNYYLGYEPFARVVHDKSVKDFFMELHGDAMELGAGSHDYSTYAVNVTRYVRSNYKSNPATTVIYQDATSIDMGDGLLDSITMLGTLEHIYEFEKVIQEVYRVLKPGGHFLLTVPWVFPHHAAPDDYYRFSVQSLKFLHKNFRSIKVRAVGNYWITQAIFLQRPRYSRPSSAKGGKWFDYILRVIGIVFIILGKNSIAGDDNYATLYTCLIQK